MEEQTVLIFVKEDVITNSVGYLKYGYRDLYFYKPKGEVIHCPKTMCVLDFYVMEDQQRVGIGKYLFDCFLQVSMC